MCPPAQTIAFAPTYSAGLVALLKSWLAYPPSVSWGATSSQSYVAGEDAIAVLACGCRHNPHKLRRLLNLVLAVLTEGYIVPAPVNAALGELIITTLLPTPTVAALAAVTRAGVDRLLREAASHVASSRHRQCRRAHLGIRAACADLLSGRRGRPDGIVRARHDCALRPQGPHLCSLLCVPTSAILVGMSVVGPGIAPGHHGRRRRR